MKDIPFYDKYCFQYLLDTFFLNMNIQYDLFLKYMKDGSRILDFGCGCGRDIKYFLSHDYDVSGLDGSKELCDIAFSISNIKVRNIKYDDFNDKDMYDGVWACSSLVHLNNRELKEVLIKIRESLKRDGILFTSLKDGIGESIDQYGRYFNYINREDFENLSRSIGLEPIDYCRTLSKKDNKTIWNNYILRRV